MSTPDYTDHRKPNVGLSEELDDLAPVGYFTTDSEGVFTRVNKAFLTLCGYASGDLVGQRRFRDLLSRGGQAFHETHYSPMLRLQGRVEAIAFDLVRKDSNRVPILVNAALTGDTIRAAAFDVTERRRYEKQLLLAKEAAVADRQRISDLARALQQTLIPPKPPIIDGLDVAARYRPAGDGHEVGGDFYDVFQVGAQEWVLAIGDVCGKGIAAGIVTSLARHVVREASAKFSDPAQALQALNEVILTEGNRRFCTAVVVRLRRDSRTWTVTISVGGHPLPLLLGAGKVELVGEPGPLLGVIPGAEFTSTDFVLRPGQTILLHTDGVTEGRRDREFFGEARLNAILGRHRGASAALADEVLDEVLAFQNGNARDDIALLIVGAPGDADA